MKINLIIGAGQLGSRHLQGLLRLEEKQTIYVVDPSAQSLQVARERAAEINHEHTIQYLERWNDLPQEFDLVIIATGASVRAKVVSQLLENYTVKNLVLEKILFQDLDSYNTIGSLIKKTQTPVWVNHPRRMLQHYMEIKEILTRTNEKIMFHVVGGNWGLACNGLHFIDLCAFLTNSDVRNMNMDWIDPVVYESKRANCIEFTGSVKGKMDNGSEFLITSLDGEIGDITVYISTSSYRWIVQEGRLPKTITLSGDFAETISKNTTVFQSELTRDIAENIFRKGSPGLPTYEEACESHIPFIETSLKKYTELTGIQTTICPIT